MFNSNHNPIQSPIHSHFLKVGLIDLDELLMLIDQIWIGFD